MDASSKQQSMTPLNYEFFHMCSVCKFVFFLINYLHEAARNQRGKKKTRFLEAEEHLTEVDAKTQSSHMLTLTAVSALLIRVNKEE